MTGSIHTARAVLAILADAANSVTSSVPVTVEPPMMTRNATDTGWRVSVAFEVSDEVAVKIDESKET